MPFFGQWFPSTGTVLDPRRWLLRAHQQRRCGVKYAMDLNPVVHQQAAGDITVLQQDCSAPWPLPEGKLDAVFTSNFLEHLPDKVAVSGHCSRETGLHVDIGGPCSVWCRFHPCCHGGPRYARTRYLPARSLGRHHAPSGSPQPQILSSCRDAPQHPCPRCGHQAYRDKRQQRTLHDLGDLDAGVPVTC